MAEMLIYKSINNIMLEAATVAKNKKNLQQGFMYRGIDAVMNVFSPLLAKHGVFVAPEVLQAEREERTTKNGNNIIFSILNVRFRFYAVDGSYIDAVVQGEGMDTADKASNKAMSVAMKYALFQVFCIPTEEMDDPDADSPAPSTPSATPKKTMTPRKPSGGGTEPLLKEEKPAGRYVPSEDEEAELASLFGGNG